MPHVQNDKLVPYGNLKSTKICEIFLAGFEFMLQDVGYPGS